MPFDFAILDWIQLHLRHGLLDFLAPRITALGDHGFLWIILAAALLLHPKTRRMGKAVALSLLLEFVACDLLIKPLVARPRPCDLNPAVAMLISRPHGHSFPSGHTGASFASAFALWRGKSPLGLPALVLAALIAFTRLYLYVHFPTDVLGGLLLGLAAGWAGERLARPRHGAKDSPKKT